MVGVLLVRRTTRLTRGESIVSTRLRAAAKASFFVVIGKVRGLIEQATRSYFIFRST
jgi:hypothetical protein